MRTKSQERLEMGEKEWKERRKIKNRGYQKRWYDRHPDEKSHWVTVHKRKKKKALVEYKGGRCEMCNYDKCFAALDFHHKNPDKKDFNVSSKKSLTLERLKKEVDKCIMLCKNCHTEIHQGNSE